MIAINSTPITSIYLVKSQSATNTLCDLTISFMRTYSLGELASLLGRVEDLIVEDGEVERQTEADGMRGLHLGLSNLEGLLVSLLRIFENLCSSVTHSHLGEVPVIISLHLQVKDLGFGIAGLGDEVFVQKVL